MRSSCKGEKSEVRGVPKIEIGEARRPCVLSVLPALVLNDFSQCLPHFWNLCSHGLPSVSLCLHTAFSSLCLCSVPLCGSSLLVGTLVTSDLDPPYSVMTLTSGKTGFARKVTSQAPGGRTSTSPPGGHNSIFHSILLPKQNVNVFSTDKHFFPPKKVILE